MTMKRQKELELLISRLQKAYYDGNPIVSDSEFDSLWEELKERFPNSELLSKVGSDTIKSNKVEHIMLMGSQNKVNTESDFEKWSDSIEDTSIYGGVSSPIISEEEFEEMCK